MGLAIASRISAARADDAFIVTATQPASVQAPADVYFGPYRLSNLSVRNAIHDMDVEGDSPLALPGQVERITAVEAALAQWSLAYPRDPWLPPSIHAFASFLLGKGLPQYDRVAFALLDELTLRYGASADGKAASDELAAFSMLPQFDLATAAGVWPLPVVAASKIAGIGDNRRRGFL